MNVHAKLTLPETTPLAVVQAYFAAFGAGDLDGVLALLADNVVWHVDGSVTVPTIGLLRGRERVHRWLSEFPNGFTPRVFAIDRLFESGDDVMALGRFRHLARATGRVVGSDLAIRFTVRDGRIERYQIMEDSLLLARAFDPYDAWGEHEVRLNGTTYAHSDRGDGPVVLFAHGLFVDRTIFDPQVTTLEATHRCIVLDMPGHGRSGWRKEGWTLEDVAEDLALFIEEASLGPVSFIGQSQGGMIGMRLAARRPDLVSRLVLIGTSARSEDPERLPRWHEVRRTLAGGLRGARGAVRRHAIAVERSQLARERAGPCRLRACDHAGARTSCLGSGRRRGCSEPRGRSVAVAVGQGADARDLWRERPRHVARALPRAGVVDTHCAPSGFARSRPSPPA